MSSLHKRKIKIVSISQKFYNLFSPDDEIMKKLGQESKERPCLILLKLSYKNNKYTFAIPFRSNIGNAPKGTFFSLPKRKKTRDGRHHGLHYTKMFPITKEFFLPYHMGGDFEEELVMAFIEKNIKKIIQEAQNYLFEYEKGNKPLYHVDIDDVLDKIMVKVKG
ncbi:hypothetical protein [Absiella sp. AM29-15]|uniref:hypothetical protein n=1 Tax=Absiella sp. AM29-15 TaxID=2292278 RepID=UPI000E40B633|nr:hypothetical protein [Absiella sp. AM29-15]RGC47187.1 hypothetical protein DW761_16250 [Absiella sp. AM29-15]